jgi:Ca2+-binding EF-hand superfamily protein
MFGTDLAQGVPEVRAVGERRHGPWSGRGLCIPQMEQPMQIGSIGGMSMPSQSMRNAKFKLIDTNGDNALSRQEFKAGAPKGGGAPAGLSDKLFDRFDQNADGALTQDELDTGMKGMAKQMQRAMSQHQQGDSTSLIDLLFSREEANTQSVSSVEDAGASSGDTADMQARRELQWLLDAVSSQYSVNSALREAA